MYRWLLCWRYLRTRYIALASVISVTLGVATLIVVNSVMDGFTTEMQGRMHGILSDVILESHSANGLTQHQTIQQRVREVVGSELEGMTAVVHVPAMVNIEHRGESITRQINLIGIDSETYASVSDFSKYLMHPQNQEHISFDLKEQGYAPARPNFPESGWVHRRRLAAARKRMVQLQMEYELERLKNEKLKDVIDRVDVSNLAVDSHEGSPDVSDRASTMTGNGEQVADEENADEKFADEKFAEEHSPLPTPPPEYAHSATDSDGQDQPQLASPVGAPSFDAVASRPEDKARVFDPESEQHTGIVLGISIGSTRYRDEFGKVSDYYYVQPGDDVRVTFPSSGNQPTAINQLFTVVDFYESKMSEYDATFAFVPLEKLQSARGMEGAVCSIQLRLREGANLNHFRDALRHEFRGDVSLQINTWRDLQGALLAAVQMETTILNILLFLIIAVAGFGILATFFMIVVEKTKDIGVLKSLGASGSGVASIFLGYGVLLGAFGAGVGAVAGLVFVAYINNIADALETITGQAVFDPTVYYFETIPTIVHPWMVVWVVVGAVFIAVMASVLPSIRAARMHPVEALRYE